eukprot:CAMPEP_0179125502 /NCGR_PEP_ID=MMETSP0796-20121207/59357_1 /TAXON_ID=73915 /ORGANISM="Pyrodinium bahamense, Strain pbaha01" /LENGTH=395 /DNA_ID=CAMNT_0020824203 /DNA_START=132 /DNA_END=1319 /DNA_ORIENTATION=-
MAASTSTDLGAVSTRAAAPGAVERRCPVTGRLATSGVCPMARAAGSGGGAGRAAQHIAGPAGDAVDHGEGEQQVALRAGLRHLAQHEHVKALKAFSRVLELSPTDTEASRGKVLALQGLNRPRGALRACLVALKLQSEWQPLLALREELVAELGDETEEVVAEVEALGRKARSEPCEASDCDSRASTEEPTDERPACPASRAPSAEYRTARKVELVTFYRDFYRRTSTKTVSTAQYSADEKNSLSIKDGHRHMPRPAHVDLPQEYKQPVGTLTPSQLSTYDCNNDRLLICVHGDLFDVSDRPDKYGPEGPYHSMAGHDITWALWSGYDNDSEWDKYFDLHKAKPKEERDRRFQGLMSWWAFYEQEYGSPVGRLDVYENEWTLVPPPTVKDLCSVM